MVVTGCQYHETSHGAITCMPVLEIWISVLDLEPSASGWDWPCRLHGSNSIHRGSDRQIQRKQVMKGPVNICPTWGNSYSQLAYQDVTDLTDQLPKGSIRHETIVGRWQSTSRI